MPGHRPWASLAWCYCQNTGRGLHEGLEPRPTTRDQLPVSLGEFLNLDSPFLFRKSG